MAINITSLQPSKNNSKLTDSDATFRDVGFDFNLVTSGGSNQLFSKTSRKDLGVDTDYKAIDNSLNNIFNTSPGQKILNPRFGADLKRYLFQPVTEETAQLLGEVIMKSIELYEPRITVNELFIKAFPDEHLYTIDIYCSIPALRNKNYKFSTNLTDAGTTASY